MAGFAGALLGGLIVTVIFAAFGADVGERLPPGALMLATFLQDVSFVAAAILFARLTGPVAARHFGLRAPRVLHAIAWTVAVYVGFLALSGLWTALVDLEQEQRVLEDLGVGRSDLALVGAAVLVCLLAPLVEEFLFRGFFFRALRNWRGFWPAALITGVIFAAPHWEGPSSAGVLVPLAILGFGFCLLYERTGSLYSPIALHAINNSVAFGIAVEWTWQIPLLTLGSLLSCGAVAIGTARIWRGGADHASSEPLPARPSP